MQTAQRPNINPASRSISLILIVAQLSSRSSRYNRRNFTDPDILRAERETIFRRCWLYVGHDSELPEPTSYLTRQVGNGEILFTRDAEGEVHAFSNVCPHRGGPVCRERRGTARAFQCFYHGWVFGSDGVNRYLPNEAEYPQGFSKTADARLKRVPRLERYAGFWFLCFDPDAVSLQTYLAGATKYFDRIATYSNSPMSVINGTYEYRARANWKLLMENIVDSYHGAPTHASYVEHLARLNKQYQTTGDGEPGGSVVLVNERDAEELGNGHVVNETHGSFGRPIAKWHPSFGEEGKREIDAVYEEMINRLGPQKAERAAHWNFNMLVFPNLAIVDVHTTNLRTVNPVSADEMLVCNSTIGPSDETPALRRIRLLNTMEFLGPGGFGTPDDVAALEACQRGYKMDVLQPWNDISGGLKVGNNHGGEMCMRAYWRRWNEFLSAETA